MSENGRLFQALRETLVSLTLFLVASSMRLRARRVAKTVPRQASQGELVRAPERVVHPPALNRRCPWHCEGYIQKRFQSSNVSGEGIDDDLIHVVKALMVASSDAPQCDIESQVWGANPAAGS